VSGGGDDRARDTVVRRLVAAVVLVVVLGGLAFIVSIALDFGKTYGFRGAGARGIPGVGLVGGMVVGLLLNVARSLAELRRPLSGGVMLAAIVAVTLTYTVALAVGSAGR
jgi:hypothetical protein